MGSGVTLLRPRLSSPLRTPSLPSAIRSWSCACTTESTLSSPRSLTSSNKVMFPFSCPCRRCAVSGSSFELHPDKASPSSPVLGTWDVKLKVAPNSHLALDILDLSRLMWNVRFDKHKKSSFLTYFTHHEYWFHQKTQGSSSQEEVPEKLAVAADDEWAIDEANMELIRVHRQMRTEGEVRAQGRPHADSTGVPGHQAQDDHGIPQGQECCQRR